MIGCTNSHEFTVNCPSCHNPRTQECGHDTFTDVQPWLHRGKEAERASALYITVLSLTQPACLPYNTIRKIYTGPPDPRALFATQHLKDVHAGLNHESHYYRSRHGKPAGTYDGRHAEVFVARQRKEHSATPVGCVQGA